MKFIKMHGLGNDYVFVDCFQEHVEDPVSLARALSDRHAGIGADGLILIQPSGRADVRMEVYNADGSLAQMCGNGIRCVAKYAVERGLAGGPELRIDTDAGVRSARCHAVDGSVRSVRIDMGPPSLLACKIPTMLSVDRIIDHPLLIDGVTYQVTCVSVGNPHAIVFVDDLDGIALESIGPKFERAPEFPERINAHFARADSPTHVTMRTWERGSGVTQACGTGACAVCVAGVVTERTQRKIITTLPGGDLEIEWAHDGHVCMTGPAVEVFTGEWPM